MKQTTSDIDTDNINFKLIIMKEITLKTKFDLGESAFYYDSTEHKLKEHRIELVSFMVDATSVKIWYYNHDGGSISEDLLFRTKQEFIDSL